jgi:hypothetical protein
MRAFALLLLAACVIPESVHVTFGDNGEGLDGFLCKDKTGMQVLDRMEASAGVDGGVLGADGGVDAPGGVGHAALITDFLTLSGVPGCRTSQLIDWCSSHDCHAIDGTRQCTEIELPTGVTGLPRETIRAAVKANIDALHDAGTDIIGQAPQGFVMLRIIATAQTCAEALDTTRLVGGAYSCPVDFNAVQQDVYVGFDTLAGQCEQGLRTMASAQLTWQP